MSLHLVFSLAGLSACEARRAPDDIVVLLGDGVHALRTGAGYRALTDDLAARGIESAAHAIDYDELVGLVAAHAPVVSWLA